MMPRIKILCWWFSSMESSNYRRRYLNNDAYVQYKDHYVDDFPTWNLQNIYIATWIMMSMSKIKNIMLMNLQHEIIKLYMMLLETWCLCPESWTLCWWFSNMESSNYRRCYLNHDVYVQDQEHCVDDFLALILQTASLQHQQMIHEEIFVHH